jgi:hypothetical protein
VPVFPIQSFGTRGQDFDRQARERDTRTSSTRARNIAPQSATSRWKLTPRGSADASSSRETCRACEKSMRWYRTGNRVRSKPVVVWRPMSSPSSRPLGRRTCDARCCVRVGNTGPAWFRRSRQSSRVKPEAEEERRETWAGRARETQWHKVEYLRLRHDRVGWVDVSSSNPIRDKWPVIPYPIRVCLSPNTTTGLKFCSSLSSD